MAAARKALVIKEANGVYVLSGDIDEFADLSSMATATPPLKINLRAVQRCNSVGIKNLLLFLTKWGNKPFEYHDAPPDFVDQVSCIPALLGTSGRSGKLVSMLIPYVCTGCDHEEDIPGKSADFVDVAARQKTRPCPKCQGEMEVANPTFFAFLDE